MTWYAKALVELGTMGPVPHAAMMKGDRAAAQSLVERIEREVQAAPEACFRFASDGRATLTAAGRTFVAGHFSVPTIGELRARVAARPRDAAARLVLSILRGAHPLTDIGTLQATAEPGTLFQVASQFNCLEAPDPCVVPVGDYLYDSTQGPRASISAFPGTFLRHYSAPAVDGGRFVQTDERGIDLLGDVFDPSVAEIQSGYLQLSRVRDLDALAAAVTDRFDQVRVGVHDDVEVVFGHDWAGPVPNAPNQRVAQVLTSTMALGGYGRDDGSAAIATARRQILRGAYLGTLLAAVDRGKDTVVLTMIGGGVFGNPHRDIWDAIHWASAEVEPFVSGTMNVLVNTREHVADADRERVRARGGVFVELGGPEIVVNR